MEMSSSGPANPVQPINDSTNNVLTMPEEEDEPSQSGVELTGAWRTRRDRAYDIKLIEEKWMTSDDLSESFYELLEYYFHNVVIFPLSVYQRLGKNGTLDLLAEVLREKHNTGVGDWKPDKHLAEKLDKVFIKIGKLIGSIRGKQFNLYGKGFGKTNAVESIFVAAVWFQRKRLAMYCLGKTKNPIVTALIGSHLSHKLHKLAKSETEFDLAQRAAEFSCELDAAAARMIITCHEQDGMMAVKMVIRRTVSPLLPDSKTFSLLSLAHVLKCKSFLGTSPCQARLEQVWKGYFIESNKWILRFGLIFPPVVCFAKNMNDSVVLFCENHSFVEEVCQEIAIEDHWYPCAKDLRGRGFRQRPDKKRWPSITPLSFFLRTPFVKFYYHAIARILFVGLFSFFTLTILAPRDERPISEIEYVVWAWAGTTLLEEVRQAFFGKRYYFLNIWNILDMIIHMMILVSVILHYALEPSQFVWVRRSYSVALYLSFIRLLDICYAWKRIGPVVIMIRKMIEDILRILLLFLVFYLAHAVTAQALKYPNSEYSMGSFINILYQPYWHSFGELFGNNGQVADPGSCTTNETLHRLNPSESPKCPENSHLSVIFLGIYVILANVLLLNLLVGMFASTYERIQKKSEIVWKFYRYELVEEYFHKPVFAPPMILIGIVWHAMIRLNRCIARRERGKEHDDTGPFYQRFTQHDEKVIARFEEVNVKRFWSQEEKAAANK